MKIVLWVLFVLFCIWSFPFLYFIGAEMGWYTGTREIGGKLAVAGFLYAIWVVYVFEGKKR